MKTAKTALAVILASTLGMTACTRQVVVQGPSGSVGPSLVVEQFLRAANAEDLEGMGRLFGTKDGPITARDSKQDVERRMFAIARELKHSDYEIVREDLVPGRTDEATLLTVSLKIEAKKYNLPFTLVRYKKNWLIERIGIEVLTAPR